MLKETEDKTLAELGGKFQEKEHTAPFYCPVYSVALISFLLVPSQVRNLQMKHDAKYFNILNILGI